jgi:hypothetical protein
MGRCARRRDHPAGSPADHDEPVGAARSREISERYQRAYDESDALDARYEELREMFETARALYELRMALHPGDGNPWRD